VADLATSRVLEKVPRDNSNDFNPIWIGDRIFFLSDRNGPVTLFSYDMKSRKVAQLIPNDGFDFKSASAGPGSIICEQFGALHVYSLSTGKAQRLNVRIAADLAEVRPRYVKVASRIANANVSPTGVRAVFEARGEILTVPVEKGDIRNLTRTAGVMERDPAWSPDGTRIAYFSDESGEYELHVREQGGTGETKKIRIEDAPSFYYRPVWSPDSKKIAFTDKRLNLWYADLEKTPPVKVDRTVYFFCWSGLG
jgi:tricorn protease